MKNNRLFYAIAGLFALLVLLGGDCLAADAPVSSSTGKNVIDTALDKINEATNKWSDALDVFSRQLFFILATISFVWHMGKRIFEEPDIGGFFYDIISWVVVTGVWFTILRYARSILRYILSSFQIMGGRLSPNGAVSPSEMLGNAFVLFEVMWKNIQTPGAASMAASALWNGVADAAADVLLAVLPIMLMALFMVVGVIIIAIMTAMKLASAYMLIYAGYFYFAFAGCEWTRPIARKYLNAVVAAGAEVFCVLLSFAFVEGIMSDNMATMQAVVLDPEASLTIQGCFAMTCSVVLALYFIKVMPPMLGGIVNSVVPSVNTPGTIGNIVEMAKITGKMVVAAATAAPTGGGSIAAAAAYEAGKTGVKIAAKKLAKTVASAYRDS